MIARGGRNTLDGHTSASCPHASQMGGSLDKPERTVKAEIVHSLGVVRDLLVSLIPVYVEIQLQSYDHVHSQVVIGEVVAKDSQEEGSLDNPSKMSAVADLVVKGYGGQSSSSQSLVLVGRIDETWIYIPL